MLAAWSRAQQNHGACGCIPCISPGGALDALRRPRDGRIFTSRGPLIFSASFTADPKSKSTEKLRFDKAFAHLREALQHPQHVSAVPKAGHAASTQQENRRAGSTSDTLSAGDDWDLIQRLVGMDLVDDHVLREQEVRTQSRPDVNNDVTVTPWDRLQWSKYAFDASLDVAPPDWLANTGPDMATKNLPPQSIWASMDARLKAMRRRHTWKKLALQRASAALVICKLMHAANLPRFFDSPEESVPRVSPHIREIAFYTQKQAHRLTRELLGVIEMLHEMPIDSAEEDIEAALQRLDRPEVPRYSQDADGEYHHVTQRMNQGIVRQILQATSAAKDRSQAFAIANICHNLFVSSASPSLATFNMLLSGFRSWGRPQLVDHVIAALYAHKIRPNEVTCVEILKHYTQESRPDDFSRFVAKIRGVGDALMLADPNITINEAGSGRLVRISEQKVLQKVYPTSLVFTTLLRGVLKFAGFDRAMDVYYEMKADGWGLDVLGLVFLLRQCIPTADWEGGLYVWEEVNSIKNESRQSDMARAYSHMLSLSSVTGNTTAFNQIVNELVRRGYDRKAIIDDAMRLTRWALKKAKVDPPAFTADTLLIAGYKEDADSASDESDPDAEYDMDMPQPQESQRWSESSQSTTQADQQISPEEAWSTWLEHELGERPKDPKP